MAYTCVSVCTGVCAETAKVKMLMDQETQILPTFPTKALSLTHMPSQVGHQHGVESVTAVSSEGQIFFFDNYIIILN